MTSSAGTALEIVLDRQDHSLVLLLVANGYDMNAEPESPLDWALRRRRLDYLDLFLDWGADPRQVDLVTLYATYDSQLYERFRRLGVDFTSGHALAYSLGHHTSNKPLLCQFCGGVSGTRRTRTAIAPFTLRAAAGMFPSSSA